ncbi:acetyl-CoA C-acyltransferase [Mycobacterium syngnathidarum]
MDLICNPVRTPVGRMGGTLTALAATDRTTTALQVLIDRTRLGEDDVDDIVLGNRVPGLRAVLYAAEQVANGPASVVIADWEESMSNIEHYVLCLRGVRHGDIALMDRLDQARQTTGESSHPIAYGMRETAENVRREYGITRDGQDERAVRLQQHATAAHEADRFADALVPVTVPGNRRNPDVVVEHDEPPRADISVEKRAAGKASAQNDGAALCEVTTATAVPLGLTLTPAPRSWAVTGCGPEAMDVGPVNASAAALQRAGLVLDDIDLIELTEVCAAHVLVVMAEWKIDPLDDRLNPNGSGISLEHPIGTTDALILTTAAYEAGCSGARTVLETMCICGGQGLAAVFEVVR